MLAYIYVSRDLGSGSPTHGGRDLIEQELYYYDVLPRALYTLGKCSTTEL